MGIQGNWVQDETYLSVTEMLQGVSANFRGFGSIRGVSNEFQKQLLGLLQGASGQLNGVSGGFRRFKWGQGCSSGFRSREFRDFQREFHVAGGFRGVPVAFKKVGAFHEVSKTFQGVPAGFMSVPEVLERFQGVLGSLKGVSVGFGSVPEGVQRLSGALQKIWRMFQGILGGSICSAF